MAIRQQSGFLTEEKPKSITQQSMEQGTGTPESPMGAQTAGATPKQQDMVGTPAQQESAKQVRRDQQESKTLEEAKRYEQKPQVDQYQQAKEKAASLAELGPVKSRVQSLIEQKMADVSATTAELSANQAKIDSLPEEQRAAAQTALNDYLSNPTEENIQKFYDVVGKAELEAGGISSYLVGDEEAIAGLAQGQLGGQVTLDQLDLGQLGVDMSELEAQLGLQPGEAAGMSLDQLDQAIDAIEAQELNQVESIRAQLADPSLPPQQRQQLLQQLSALGAAGMTGMEEQINQLDEQIAAADTMEIGGVTMSLEEALGDDGISATIKNAVTDPSYLEQLKNVPGYEQLGDWIETNKSLLEGLVGEVEDTATDFLEVQSQYRGVKESLGGTKLLKQLFPDVDWDKNSLLSSDMQKIQESLDKNEAYKFLTENEERVVQANNDEEFFNDITSLATRGFDSEGIEDVLDTFKLEIDEDETLQALLGGEVELPKNKEEWEKTKELITRYDKLDPAIIQTEQATNLIRDGVVDIEDLELISNSDFGQEILEDITSNIKNTNEWERDIAGAADPVKAMKKQIFGHTNFSVNDANYAMNYGSEEAAAAVKAIFDLDGDGTITQEELNSPESVERAKAHRGLGSSVDSMIDQQGAWDSQNGLVTDFDPSQMENELKTNLKATGGPIDSQLDHYQNHATKLEQQKQEVVQDTMKKLGMSEDKVSSLIENKEKIYDILEIKRQLNVANSTQEVGGVTISTGNWAEAQRLEKVYMDAINNLTATTGLTADDFTGVRINKLEEAMTSIPKKIASLDKRIAKTKQAESNLRDVYDSIDNMSEEELMKLTKEWS